MIVILDFFNDYEKLEQTEQPQSEQTKAEPKAEPKEIIKDKFDAVLDRLDRLEQSYTSVIDLLKANKEPSGETSEEPKEEGVADNDSKSDL